MKQSEKITAELQRLVAQSDWRFAIGLRIRFNHPTLLYQTYPEAWVAHYAQHGLLLQDPTVLWGMTHTGLCDWADLVASDTGGVLERAKDYGLAHGIVVSVGEVQTRSLGFFAHALRPVTAAERALATEVMQNLHAASAGTTDLAPAAIAQLMRLGTGLHPLA